MRKDRLRNIRAHLSHQSKYLEALRLRKCEALTGIEIARRIGMNPRTVRYWLQETPSGDTVRVLAPHLNAYRLALRLRTKSKISAEKIAKRLGLCPRTVGYWFQKNEKGAGNVEHGK